MELAGWVYTSLSRKRIIFKQKNAVTVFYRLEDKVKLADDIQAPTIPCSFCFAGESLGNWDPSLVCTGEQSCFYTPR